ncbi:hypothetical protein [Novipirellula artificiosorum]|uniref:hypothetical protein n=1 Tax=Novipirellula artificiosorum TaxID=2528016 RepID=UPI0011B4A960|nr:hypothetical protein [Novipirellula artificiosorum]
MLLLLLSVIAASSILWDWWLSGRLFCKPLPRPYRDRHSQLAAWERTCSDEVMDKTDALLQTLCEAFSFNPDDRYRFSPNDRIMDVYRACYPRWRFWKISDCMEIESLMMDIQRRFQLSDTEVLEMTLAEVAELMSSTQYL